MSSVDLPLPDGPTRLSDLPASTERSTPLRTWTAAAPGAEADMQVLADDDWLPPRSPFHISLAPRA